jgi:CubicO group peptidase (beta-lactamase class C family)
VIGALPVDGDFDRARFPRLAAELERGIAAGLQHGGQVFVSLAGETRLDAGFGQARPGEPMGRERAMYWLSATKPFAAVAIAQLWERGALHLDDPVARHLPEFAAGGKQAITIRHLLTHTAGIRMLDLGWPELGWDGVLARIAARRIEPGWVPGRKAGYHLASSWFVLGELVRRLDGRPFDRYVRAEILEPLGAGSCWIGVPEDRLEQVRARIAPAFQVTPQGMAALVSWDDDARLTVCSPGACGLGPMRELALLYEMLAAGGVTATGRRLLGEPTAEALAARHRVGLHDHTFRTRLDWGLGVIVNSAHYGDPQVPYGYGPHAGPRTFGHSGARSTTAFADPDARLVVALGVNGLPEDAAHRERFERLLAALFEDLDLAPPPAG